MSSRTVAQLGIFVALVAALGFALAGVPNVELMTLSTFVAGALLGPAPGAIVGAGGAAIYSGFNPYGMAPPPVFAAQVLGFAGIGTAGGLFGGRLLPGAGLRAVPAMVLGGVLGLLVTLFYDVITNLGTAWVMGAMHDPWPVLVAGITFGIWHLVWNVAFFAFGLPPLLAALRRRRARAL